MSGEPWHGTVGGYTNHGCRDECCRSAAREYERSRWMRRAGRADFHKRTVDSIPCRWCHREIEHCDGRFGDWMHSEDRREHCPDGRIAEPRTVGRVA